jgi:thiamine-phosphate pyrophosphorylase
LLLYYITDRMQFAGDEVSRRRLLLDKIGEAAACGVDFIQLREKDLPPRELERLACDASEVLRENTRKTKLLINSRSDVALASAADGIHLRANDISPRDVGLLWQHSGKNPTIGVSCHSLADVERAKTEGADFVVFGPVFEKKNSQPSGLNFLQQACAFKIPVLALGGVTLENARACVDAGAAGIAAIRLFQENDVAGIVQRLRD